MGSDEAERAFVYASRARLRSRRAGPGRLRSLGLGDRRAPGISHVEYQRQGFLVHDCDREVVGYRWCSGRLPVSTAISRSVLSALLMPRPMLVLGAAGELVGDNRKPRAAARASQRAVVEEELPVLPRPIEYPAMSAARGADIWPVLVGPSA
jgi:hypothetical protein